MYIQQLAYSRQIESPCSYTMEHPAGQTSWPNKLADMAAAKKHKIEFVSVLRAGCHVRLYYPITKPAKLDTPLFYCLWWASAVFWVFVPD